MNKRKRIRYRQFKCRQGVHRWYSPWHPTWHGRQVCADCGVREVTLVSKHQSEKADEPWEGSGTTAPS